MIINQKYLEKCSTHSDINEHLPHLYQLACSCETVVEFGVRDVVSSYAFANARPKKLICVDIYKSPNIDTFLEECKSEDINSTFIQQSTLELEIEPIDLLFIDTLHTYNQLAAELEKHANKAKKYIVLHDTITFGYRDEVETNSDKKGLIPALSEFLQNNTNWKELKTFSNNNGLTILKRL